MIQIKHKITGAVLYENKSEANLSEANLSRANLSWANLSEANLSRADLSGANLSRADLSRADLSRANLSRANLSEANLSRANLSEANLSRADLSRANLSRAKNLLDPIKWMAQKFRSDSKGYLVYKAIGHTTFTCPPHWEINEGAFLSEVPNPLPTLDCACGVNFATKKWCLEFYAGDAVEIWLCRINWKDLPSVVVPYNTNGKARCGRLELIKKVRR